MLSLIIMFAIGIGVGSLLRRTPGLRPYVDRLMQVAVCALMLVLGISVGVNPQIMQNLTSLGLEALALTFGAVLGSILVVRALFVNKKQSTRP